MTARYLTKARLAELEARLTAPDWAILRSVSELRFMTGSQLTRRHFDGEAAASARAARRALLRLTRLDCLARLPRRVGGVRSGSAGFVYCLGLAGQTLAIERGWQPTHRGRRSGAPGTLFVDHALQVAELHTLLVEADRSGRMELLELRAEPACWRKLGGMGPQRFTLKPDSFVRLGNGDFEDNYFIEVDRGTEGSRALEAKLRQYLVYQASGVEQTARGVFPKVLWFTPDRQRAAVIEACIDSLPRAERTLFEVAVFDDSLPGVNNTVSVTDTQPN